MHLQSPLPLLSLNISLPSSCAHAWVCVYVCREAKFAGVSLMLADDGWTYATEVRGGVGD